MQNAVSLRQIWHTVKHCQSTFNFNRGCTTTTLSNLLNIPVIDSCKQKLTTICCLKSGSWFIMAAEYTRPIHLINSSVSDSRSDYCATGVVLSLFIKSINILVTPCCQLISSWDQLCHLLVTPVISPPTIGKVCHLLVGDTVFQQCTLLSCQVLIGQQSYYDLVDRIDYPKLI